MKTTISKVAFFVSALVLSTAGIGDEEYPQPGYVFADPDPDTSGHMGVIDFDGCGISAGMANVNRYFKLNSPSIVIRKLREDNL